MDCRVQMALIVLAGCLRTAAFPCDETADCQRGGEQGVCEPTGFCSFEDGSCAGGRRYGELSGPFANECVAGENPPCEDGPATCADADTLRTCTDGQQVDRVCSLGCDEASGAHCRGIVPSNGIPVLALTDGDGVVDTGVTGSLTFDTDTGSIVGSTTLRNPGTGYDANSKIAFQVVVQTGAPSIGVFSFASLDVAVGTTIRTTGSNAFALVAEGAIVIRGIIEITGGAGACTSGVVDIAQCAGPGASLGGGPNTAASGPGGGGLGSGGPQGFAESGGGGGGHGGVGASGGAGTTNNTTVGTPGPQFGATDLTPLVGGGGGGGGGNEPQASTLGATGGGGGGALQITSNTSITIAGSTCGINAGGGGAGASQLSSGGGGGGAGGGILLEASVVSLETCVLAANGGGGSGASIGARGTTGLLSTAAAPGSIEGSGGTRNAGDGGAGGASTPAVAGENNSDEAGGGGGGVGVIHVKSNGAAMFTNTGQVSPAVSQSAIVTR